MVDAEYNKLDDIPEMGVSLTASKHCSTKGVIVKVYILVVTQTVISQITIVLIIRRNYV